MHFYGCIQLAWILGIVALEQWWQTNWTIFVHFLPWVISRGQYIFVWLYLIWVYKLKLSFYNSFYIWILNSIENTNLCGTNFVSIFKFPIIVQCVHLCTSVGGDWYRNFGSFYAMLQAEAYQRLEYLRVIYQMFKYCLSLFSLIIVSSKQKWLEVINNCFILYVFLLLNSIFILFHMQNFQSMLRCIKLWARRPGIYSHVCGLECLCCWNILVAWS